MVSIHGTQCCAVVELANISSVDGPLDILRSVTKDLCSYTPPSCGSPHPPQFVTFTGVTKRRTSDHASGRFDNYGQAFADFLVKNGLGSVIVSEERHNFTGNSVKIWVWHPDYDKLQPFLVKNQIEV